MKLYQLDNTKNIVGIFLRYFLLFIKKAVVKRKNTTNIKIMEVFFMLKRIITLVLILIICFSVTNQISIYATEETTLVENPDLDERYRNAGIDFLNIQNIQEESTLPETGKTNNIFPILIIGLCVTIPFFCLVLSFTKIIQRKIRKTKIKNLFKKYQKYVFIANAQTKEFKKYLKQHTSTVKVKELEQHFLPVLYSFYMENETKRISRRYKGENAEYYQKNFKRINTYQAFKDDKIIDMSTIIQNLELNQKMNWTKIDRFLQNNVTRVPHKNMILQLRTRFRNVVSNESLITDEELEDLFVKEIGIPFDNTQVVVAVG
jgi:hypothetical protein